MNVTNTIAIKSLGLVTVFLLLSSCRTTADAPVTTTTTRVACIGDSITMGAGLVNREDECYPAVLGELLGERFQVENFGVNAATVVQQGWHHYRSEAAWKQALAFEPDVVVISLGTNDSVDDNWKHKETFVPELQGMIDELSKLPTHPKIYICLPVTIFTLGGHTDGNLTGRVFPLLKQVAEANRLSMIDLHSAVNKKEYFDASGLHPNAIGARQLARTVAIALTPGGQLTELPGLPAGLTVETTVESHMGTSLEEPVRLTIRNAGAAEWHGSLRLLSSAGLTAAQPGEIPVRVAAGATVTPTLAIRKDPELNTSEFHKRQVKIALRDASGKILYYARGWMKLGCPVELAMTEVTKLDETLQPLPVLVRNLADVPVSGDVSVAIKGPRTTGAGTAFGPIPAGTQAVVTVNLPGTKLPGYDWLTTFGARAEGLTTRAEWTQVVDRHWLLLGPFPDFPQDGFANTDFAHSGYSLDFGPEKELPTGIDTTRSYLLPSVDMAKTLETWAGGWWDAMRKQWTDLLKAGVPLKWTPGPAIRSIPGGPSFESLGYLNLYDYYEKILKVPAGMTTTYALTYIKSPDDRKAVLHTGETGCLRVWLNGKEVLSDPLTAKEKRGAQPSQRKTEISLKTGWNEVLVKNCCEFFGNGFYFDVRAADNKPVSDLYWTVKKDP